MPRRVVNESVPTKGARLSSCGEWPFLIRRKKCAGFVPATESCLGVVWEARNLVGMDVRIRTLAGALSYRHAYL